MISIYMANSALLFTSGLFTPFVKIHDNGSQIFSEHIQRTICNRTMRFGLPPIIQWLTWSKEFQIGYHSIISLHKHTSQSNMSFKNLLPCYKHSSVEFEDTLTRLRNDDRLLLSPPFNSIRIESTLP